MSAVVPSLKTPVAASWRDVPFARVAVAGVSSMRVSVTKRALTVTETLAVRARTFAVRVAVPGMRPCTVAEPSPAELTVTMASLLELQVAPVAALEVAPDFTCALSGRVSPASRLREAGEIASDSVAGGGGQAANTRDTRTSSRADKRMRVLWPIWFRASIPSRPGRNLEPDCTRPTLR